MEEGFLVLFVYIISRNQSLCEERSNHTNKSHVTLFLLFVLYTAQMYVTTASPSDALLQREQENENKVEPVGVVYSFTLLNIIIPRTYFTN